MSPSRLCLLLTVITVSIFGADVPVLKDYCALKIRVEGANGQPITAPVRIFGADGREIASEKAIGGLAEFCDLGFERHRVVIGQEGSCAQTVIENVQINFPEPLTLRAVLNECFGQEIAIGNCLVLLRVKSRGRPVSGTKIEFDSTAGPHSELVTDKYGRVFKPMRIDSTMRATVQLGGKSNTVDVECIRGNPNLEVTIAGE